jgi:hypothetical protein
MKDKKHIESSNIPKNYFEEFEERLFSKLSEDIIPKETGFSVPEGYFNTLENKIATKVENTDNNKKVISLFSRKTLLYAASIAAVSILIFSLINSYNSIVTINEIDISSIESYIEEGSLDYNSQDITALLSNEDLSQLSTENAFISDNNITDYLIEYIEDTSILIE